MRNLEWDQAILKSPSKTLIDAMATSGSEGREMSEGALYSVEERLDTFQVSYCNWPFDSGPCTPLKMAEAGFYFCGTETTPDWVRCVVCQKDLDGWEATDQPLEEHRTLSPLCPFLKIKDPYKITVGEVIELEHKALDYCVKIEAAKLEEDLQSQLDGMRQELVSAIKAAQTSGR